MVEVNEYAKRRFSETCKILKFSQNMSKNHYVLDPLLNQSSFRDHYLMKSLMDTNNPDQIVKLHTASGWEF
jgi:hypothetical protein